MDVRRKKGKVTIDSVVGDIELEDEGDAAKLFQTKVISSS